jgi:hypothetical protein
MNATARKCVWYNVILVGYGENDVSFVIHQEVGNGLVIK